MIKQVQKRLKEKGINLIVDLAVQAFLTDEGYDPIYGARPLRRAIMKYLEDTLAEQCLAKNLYPNTKIHVRRKKVEGTLMTYTNDLEVEVDFSSVDPLLLDESIETNEPVAVLTGGTDKSKAGSGNISPESPNINLGDDPSKLGLFGKTSRFFRKKS